MPDYICPYCGAKINAENVLFVDESAASSYRDDVRYNFLRSCCRDWPFDIIENGQVKFTGLYFRVDSDVEVGRGSDEFPVTLSINPAKGLTATELTGAPALADETKPLDTGALFTISTRACPTCHCRLPLRFGEIPTIYVTMLGGRAAGKTAYLISLVHQLKTQLTYLNLGTAELLQESEIYYKYHNRYYQTHQGVTMATPTSERLFPFVFRYTYFNGIGGGSIKQCFIAIYDIAGEGTGNADYMLNHNGIKMADTVLLMLDPNQINGGQYFARQNQNVLPQDTIHNIDTAESHDYYDEDISTFLNKAVITNRSVGILRKVQHVIAVTTKVDQPMMEKKELFGGNCILKNDIGESHRNAIDISTLWNVQRDLTMFYSREARIDLATIVKNAFSCATSPRLTVALLAVSTYSRQKTADNVIHFVNDFTETGSKHRIIEPFLLILAYAGMIPYKESAPTKPAPAAPATTKSKGRN